MNEYFKAGKYGFTYPEEYEHLISTTEEFGELRWWFIGSSKGLFDIGYQLINEELASTVELFPFAKSSETNVIACFDKSQKVYLVVVSGSLQNVDWSKRLVLKDISAWYQCVLSGEF